MNIDLNSFLKGGLAAVVCAIVAAMPTGAATTATVGNARFTLLTDRMVRCEWSADGTFEDRLSLVENRSDRFSTSCIRS